MKFCNENLKIIYKIYGKCNYQILKCFVIFVRVQMVGIQVDAGKYIMRARTTVCSTRPR